MNCVTLGCPGMNNIMNIRLKNFFVENLISISVQLLNQNREVFYLVKVFYKVNNAQ